MNQPTQTKTERKYWTDRFKNWPSIAEVEAEKEYKAQTVTAQFTGGELDGQQTLIKDIEPELITGYRYRQGKPGVIGELAEPSLLDELPHIKGYTGPFIQGDNLVRYESLDQYERPTQEALKAMDRTQKATVTKENGETVEITIELLEDIGSR